MKTITLTGMMGSGKTTIAKAIAEKLDLKFADIDSIIEKKENMAISEIFKTKGEKYFRNIEQNTIKTIFSQKNMVIALGGGAFENQTTRDFLLANSIVIYLETSAEIIFNRIKSTTNRPLLNNNMTIEKIKSIINEREKHYKLAHYKVLTDNKSPEEIIEEIIKCLN